MLVDGAQQRVGVADRGDDLEAAVGEQLGQAGAQQDRVLGDHDSHGSSTVIGGRAAGRAVDGQRAVDRGGPLGQAAQPAARAVDGTAPPAAVVGDLDAQPVAGPVDA